MPNQKEILADLFRFNTNPKGRSPLWTAQSNNANARNIAKVNLFDSNKIHPAMETASEFTREKYVEDVAAKYNINPDKIIRLTTSNHGLNTCNLSMRELFEKVI